MVYSRGQQPFLYCGPVKNRKFFVDRLSKHLFSNEISVSLLQWGTTANSNVRCNLMIYLHCYGNKPELLKNFLQTEGKSIWPDNELSTKRHQSADRWLPTTGMQYSHNNQSYNYAQTKYSIEIGKPRFVAFDIKSRMHQL